MCNLPAAASSALSIAGAVTSTSRSLAQQQATYQQEVLQNQLAVMRTNIEAQMRQAEAINNYTQLQVQQQEANEASAVEKGKVAREARRARALAQVAAGESGTTGSSNERILRDIMYGASMDISSIEMSRSSAVAQAEYEKRATKLRAQTAPALITEPGRPNTHLTIAGGLLDAAGGVYNSYNQYVKR